MADNGFRTGLLIGVLTMAVVGLGIAVLVLATDEDGETAPRATSEERMSDDSTPEQVSDVYVSDPFSRQEQEPLEFQFSVNGDLVGVDLAWTDWGEPAATAEGHLDIRDYPSNDRIRVSGSIVFNELRDCAGRRYYTRAEVTFSEEAPFEPQPISMGTPCG